MHQILAMVCKKWYYLVDTHEFRAVVQRAYLDLYYDAKNWPQEHKDLFYYRGFEIIQCAYCKDYIKERTGYYRDPFSGSTNYCPLFKSATYVRTITVDLVLHFTVFMKMTIVRMMTMLI